MTVDVRVLGPEEAAAAATGLLALLVEFTPSAVDLSVDDVAARLLAPGTHVVVAERDRALLGAATLAICTTLTSGAVGLVEDVIVTESARGERIGAALMDRLHAHARELGCAYVQLTSRPSRVAANRLYRSLGYAQRETNVYRLRLTPGEDTTS